MLRLVTQIGATMATSPYELRASLLQQAEGILNHRYHQKIYEIEQKLKLGVLSVEEVQFPAVPTSEGIITEAEKLYTFVQTK